MALEETVRKLDAAYDAMMDEQARMTAMDEAVQKKMKSLVLAHYPNFSTWDADLIRKVDEAVWRSADRFVRAVEEAFYEAGQRAVAQFGDETAL